MIELLVVIGVIAILVGLIVAAAGHAMSAARQRHVEAQRESLTSAIEAYKRKVGYYPPDNPNNPAQSPLFYELTGPLPPPTQTAVRPGTLPDKRRHLRRRHGDLPGLRSNERPRKRCRVCECFRRPQPGPKLLRGCSQVRHHRQTRHHWRHQHLFGVPLSGPLATNTVDGKNLAPWSYVSTNPTNNSGSYDLWVDVTSGGKTNRFSNWSKEPQVQ